MDLAPSEGLVVAWSAVVGCGRLRRCPIVSAIDLPPLEGLVVGWSAVVGCGWRCPIVNSNRFRSAGGSGGCVVGSGRLWLAVVGFGLWSAVVGCGPVLL